MSEDKSVHPYTHPAGGWGALISSAAHVAKERNPLGSALALLRMNQADGFDCPGCAWPEPKNRSQFEFCENGVKALAFESTSKRVDPDFFSQHTCTWLNAQTDHWLEGQGRLTHPMRYNHTTDKYDPIDWDEAFALIAKTLKSLSSPDEALFYTSGRTSNEAAFMYQLLGRQFGTNNFPDCSNMCHESSGFAMTQTIGVGKGTVSLEDFEHADAIFVIGQNPGTNHPRMLTELERASKRGCKIVTFNPLLERGLESFIHPQHAFDMLTSKATPITTLYLQPLIGGDLAAMTGMIRLVLEAEEANPGKVLDTQFIAEHTHGLEELKQTVMAADWAVIESESGLTRAQIQAATDVYIQAKRVIVCWAMGLTQHKHAVVTIKQVINLLLLRGNMGRPGAGACPVRGHSNVQGDRTMGITEYPTRDFLRRLGDAFSFKPPAEDGLDAVGSIRAMSAGRAKIFVSMGGNFAAATPDTDFTFAALRKCDLTVQISTKLNRSHVVHGKDALILPCLARSETDLQAGVPQFVTVEDSMSMVHSSKGKNDPASEYLKSEVAIAAGIGEALFGSQPVQWRWLAEDYSRIRDKIEAVIPGFVRFNDRLSEPGGFYLGNLARERKWKTSTGKAMFTPFPLPILALPKGQLRLMTIRSHDQYNTTIYALDDRYRGVYGLRRVIFMNGKDIIDAGLRDGDMVDLIACWNDGVSRKAEDFRVIEYNIPAGCAGAYFPETNVLVSVDEFANISRTPVSKFIPIRVVNR